MLKEKIITKISTNKLTFHPTGVSFNVTVINNSDDFATFQVELLADVVKDLNHSWYKISPEVCTKKPPGDSTEFSIFISKIPIQGFVGLMTLTVRVFSLELPLYEESRQVLKLYIPGEGVPAPQLDLPNKEFYRYPGERFQIPVSIKSFNQRASKVNLRILGIEASWLNYDNQRDLQLISGTEIKEVFECQIPSQLAQAESKSYPFTIEAIMLDAPSVKVGGILTVLPRGYIDFKYKTLVNKSVKKRQWWTQYKHYNTQKFSLEFDNQSNLLQSAKVEVISKQITDLKLEAATAQTSDKFPSWLHFWRSKNKENLLNLKVVPDTAKLQLNGLTKFQLTIRQLRPWFGFARRKLLQVKAVTADNRIETRNDTQNLELELLPIIPLWLQFAGVLMGIILGFVIAQKANELSQQHSAPVNTVNLNGIATEVVSGSNDQTIRRWQIQPRGIKSIGVFKHTDKAVRIIRYRPVNNDRIAVGYENGEIQIFDLLSGKSLFPLTNIGQKDDRVFDLAFTKDSSSLFSGHGSGIVWQWNTEKYLPLNRRFLRQKQMGFAVNSLALVGKKETHLAVGGRFNQLKLWDLNTDSLFEVNKNLGGKEDYILSLATAMNRPELLVSSNNQGTIKIWNLDSCLTSSQKCKKLDEWNIENQAVHSVALSNDACYLATVGDDGKARLWSLDSTGERSTNQDKAGKIIRNSSQPLKSVDVVRIKDKILVTTGGNDKQVKIHRIETQGFDCE